MNEINIFNFNGKEVRIVLIENEPWFVLKDVCEVLGMSNPTMVASRLDEDERTKFNLGRQGEATVINESGLYSVILRSDKPQAKPFQKWTTSEVLPSIRKHGAYMTPEAVEKTLLSPDFIIKLATELKEERERRKELESNNSRLSVENQIMAPKAEYFDELVDRNGLTNLRDTAKMLNIQQNEFVNFLLTNRYLYRNDHGKLLPFAKYDHNLFELKEQYNLKSNWVGFQTFVTIRGREYFNRLLKL